MSACLIITQGNNMFIGADSACSVKTDTGFKRCSNDVQKLFCIGEQIFFCSGNMNNVYECVNWIYNHFTYSICIEDLKYYLLQKYAMQSDEYYNIEILIADYKFKTIYQLSQYNNFDVIVYPYSSQTRIICGGYKTSETFILAKKNILMQKSIYDIYFNTYNDIVDECVGGYLYLYSSPVSFTKGKLIEHNLKYACSNKMHLLTSEFVTSGFVNGSQIIGGEIYSENYSPTSGTYFNLNDGKFSLGGGKITYDGKDITLTGITLKWSDIDGTPTDLSYFKNDLGFQTEDQVTTITKDTIATTNVIAKNLRVQSANIEGAIHADSVNAENIIGSTFAGKTFLLGGEDNGDGSLVVRNKNGDIIVIIDVNGIQVSDGAFNYMKAEELVILSGSVLSGRVMQSGFVVTDKSLYSECISKADKNSTEAPSSPSIKNICKIENIDLTDFNKLTITSICETANGFGEAYVNFGIDNANNTLYNLPEGSGYETRTTIRTLDVSSYTGIHSLVFYQYAKSNSSYYGSWSAANIGLTSIVLHN